MALQFIKKKFRKFPEFITITNPTTKDKEEVALSIPQEESVDIVIEEPNKEKKNNKKNKEVMFDKDKISEVEAAINNMQSEVKVVKKDRGLIERTESSKIIITEDNRQVLND
jgi:hypothetical protein